jgi:ribosomal protein S18 acetylase RimI-like enzyme
MPAAPVTIRPATRADTPALIDLKWEINRAEYAVYPRDGAIPPVLDLSREAAQAGVEDYWACIDAGGGAFLVGELAGDIVCCGCWYGVEAAVSTLPAYRRQAEIGGIVVLPKARGLGLGKIIMAELERQIVNEGISHVRLIVVPGNQHAVDLYRHQGFEDFETLMIKSLSKSQI